MRLSAALSKAKEVIRGRFSPTTGGGLQSAPAKGIGKTVEDVLFFQSLRQALGSFDGVLDPYKENPWVYAAITKIADNLANTPRRLMRKGKGGKKTPVDSHPVLDLFKEPNRQLTGNQLILGTIVYLESTGEAFWVMPRPHPAAIPDAVYLFDSKRFTPRLDKEKRSVGWRYKAHSGEVWDLALWEVVQFRLFNPSDPLRGCPRWFAARQGIDQDYRVSDFNSKFFKDDNVLSGILSYKGELEDAQFKRLYDQINRPEVNGTAASRIVIIEGEQEKSFTSVPAQSFDKSLEVIKKISRSEVFAVYKMNEVVLGVYDNVKSLEGQKEARKAWWHEGLIPTINDLEDVVYTYFLKFIDPALHWEWDLSVVDALQEDFEQKLSHAERLQKLGYTLNQIDEKLELGMGAVDWGDIAYVPKGVIAITGKDEYLDLINASPSLFPSLPDPGGREPEDDPEDEDKPKALPVSKTGAPDKGFIRPSSTKRASVCKDVLARQDEFEARFLSKLKRWLMEVRTETLGNFRNIHSVKELRAKGIESLIFDEAAAIARYTQTMLPVYLEAIKSGMFSVDVEIEISANPSEFAVSPAMESALNQFLLTHLDEMAPTIVGTVRGALVDTVREGLVANETTAQISDRIRGTLNESATRAMRIARTESGAAINGGRYLEMQERRVQFTEWSTAGDDHVRDSHAAVDGEVRQLGQKFSNGLRFPNDPLGAVEEVVNCRCVALVVSRNN